MEKSKYRDEYLTSFLINVTLVLANKRIEGVKC